MSKPDYSSLEHRALVAFINEAPTPEERTRRRMQLHGRMYGMGTTAFTGSPTGRISPDYIPPFHEFPKEKKS